MRTIRCRRQPKAMIQNLVNIHRTKNKSRTTGKAFHTVKKRGNPVAFLDNHAGQDTVFIAKA